MQNVGHDGDDESENSLNEAETAVKKKTTKQAYNGEYNKRPDVVARQKEPEVVARRKKSYDEYNKNKRQTDPVAARSRNSRYRANNPIARSAEVRREENRRRYAQFQPIRQQWDIDHPCKDCGKIWLKSSEAGLRKTLPSLHG
jgi:hypothetical protein